MPPWLLVPSTLCTFSGMQSSRVPMDSDVMVRGSIKLCIALQSSRVLVRVILCSIFTVKEIVIEFFWLLYMLATDARKLATFKLRQTKNPCPYRGSRGMHFAHLLPFSPRLLESIGRSVAGGLSRTFLHDELLYKILLRLLRVGWGPPGYWGDLPP